jgi:aryl-alcohol dehydrogenase-like predicted oxidoreductase
VAVGRNNPGSQPELARQWSDALGVDISTAGELESLLLSYELRANDRGVVLCSTSSEQHLVRNAACASASCFTDETLDALGGLVAKAEIRLP